LFGVPTFGALQLTTGAAPACWSTPIASIPLIFTSCGGPNAGAASNEAFMSGFEKPSDPLMFFGFGKPGIIKG
jgi:hypothetical protein